MAVENPLVAFITAAGTVYAFAMSTPAKILTFFRRGRRLLLVLAGLLLLYALAGFLLVPWLVKPRLERAAAQTLKRPVTVAKVRFNPFTFTATVEGLRVGEPAGGDWLTLRRLRVNQEVWSLLRHTLTFSEVAVEGLTVQIALDAQGRLNFQDLLEGAPESPAAATEPSPWILAIGRFQLNEGRLAFEDRSATAPFRTVLGPVAFRVDGLRTEVGHRSGVALEAWTEAKEHLVWKGDLGFQPLASQGSLLLENLALPKYRPYEQEAVSSEIRSGTATLRAQYRLAWGGGQRRLELTDLGLTLQDLKVAERGVAEAALELPRLELRGGQADLLAPSLEVGSVVAERGVLRVQRSQAGMLNLLRLLAPPRPKPATPEARPFRLRPRDLALKGFQVDWEDMVPARPVRVRATELDLHWQDLTLDPATPSRASLGFKVGEGSLRLEGRLAPLQPSGDLQVKAEGLDLAPWDPYLDGALALRIASGKLSGEGRLGFDLRGGPADQVRYRGAASVQGLEVRDAEGNEPFLRWRQLRLTGMDLRTAPLALTLKAVDWTEPEGRLVVQADGTTNVARALGLPGGATAAPVTASAVPATPAAAPDLTIAQVAIKGGRLSFIDRSVQPNAALMLSDLDGSYLGLSSRPEAASQVDFRGRAGGLAPVTITGRAMPLRHDLDTDVALTIRGADLTDFSPYTGKYLGYTVQKGKLDVQARLRIERRNLQVENAVKLDQFYLGEKVESPDATGLPVKLGLALLRDRKGVIAFDLPVAGSLDDPDIKYGRLVWKAIFGLLGKIATSPFTLLGKLVGGEAGDLSSVPFAPGGSTLEPAATARLQALAKALQDRPELRLEAEGAVDAQADGAALRKAALEALLSRTRARGLNLPLDQAAEAPVPPGERARWLQVAYFAAFPAPPAAKDAPSLPPPPPAEQEQRLLGSLTVAPEVLARLADARAKGVVAWLLDTAQVEAARVFQVNTGQAQGAGVRFTLK